MQWFSLRSLYHSKNIVHEYCADDESKGNALDIFFCALWLFGLKNPACPPCTFTNDADDGRCEQQDYHKFWTSTARILLTFNVVYTYFHLSVKFTVACPVECHCDNLTLHIRLLNASQIFQTTSCTSQNLKRIPRDLSSDTEAILLRNNSITMHVGIKNAGQLRLLDLSHNMIQGFFGRLSLPQLEHLDMGYNLISRVSSGDNDFFLLLRNLQTLSLRGNRILWVDGDTLDLPRLKVLDLAENNLISVRVGIFASLPHLTHLDLSRNNLSDLSLKHMTLAMLNVSYNKITEMKWENVKVTKLEAVGNLFVVLDNGSLQGIEAKTLNLSCMPYLWKIASSALSGVSGVNILDLSHNYNLTFIEDGFFGKNNVTVMNLDRSRILQLPVDISGAINLTASLIAVPLSCPINMDYLLRSKPNNATCVWQGLTVNMTELQRKKNTVNWSNSEPQIIPAFPTIITIDLGSVLEVQCTAFPATSRVNWVRLDEKRRTEQPMPSTAGMLQLRPLNFVNSGKYMCRAVNEFGVANRSVQVVVTYAPVIIIPLMITHQYVTFAWNNSDPSIASQFRIRYFEHTGDNFTLIRTIFVDHLVRRYTIGNLRAATAYKFCLYLNKSGNVEELDCKNMTTKPLEFSGRSYGPAYELIIVIACISTLLFLIFMSTCLYRYYQDKQQDAMTESLSRILLSDTSAINSEASTPITYFNPGVDPLTPTTDLDIRAAFLPENHPYRNILPSNMDGYRDEDRQQITGF